MKTITLNFTLEQVQLIANALGELPYKVAEGTINEIRAQVGPQIQENQAEAAPEVLDVSAKE
jgi:hypothetical protein